MDALRGFRTMVPQIDYMSSGVFYGAFVYACVIVNFTQIVGSFGCFIGFFVALVMCGLRVMLGGVVGVGMDPASLVMHFSGLEWFGLAVLLGGCGVCLFALGSVFEHRVVAFHWIQLAKMFEMWRPDARSVNGRWANVRMWYRVPCLVRCRTVSYKVYDVMVRVGMVLIFVQSLATAVLGLCANFDKEFEKPARALSCSLWMTALATALVVLMKANVLTSDEVKKGGIANTDPGFECEDV